MLGTVSLVSVYTKCTGYNNILVIAAKNSGTNGVVNSFDCTAKPVYNDHSRDQVIVVSVYRWSLYRGALVQLKWTMSQPTMVSIDRWSLYASGL